ncbi:acyl-CoA dehydrogenase family protein [Microbacterium amylolyticum]|uniref:Alkylation response protein AidB-like acyl-CoA dehydrogenase n=1 Tax=Microbacterium amylolyticum TaxID=936337 RepID=A0ABS4ZI96_9MICO|nr:acyl-CoA dehydrogenase family protein [Microbacterium amylolyticum]MBP2436788.1 alkylation response protein AidB-like acyl-CoA dehydrogenase [Microbacterium amylolyticum]
MTTLHEPQVLTAPVTPIAERAQRFADETLRPNAAFFDRQGWLPRDVIDEMAGLGLLGAPIGTEWGGAGCSAHEYGEITEIIGRACASTRTLMTVHSSLVGQTIQRRGSREQKVHYLPELAAGRMLACFALSEPEVGSDASAVRTTYTRTADGYRLSGRKRWISFGGIADCFLVIATGEAGPCAFLVERDFGGVTTRGIDGMIGSRASAIADVWFDDVPVPAANRLGAEGAGFAFIANTALQFGRFSVAWGGVALIQEALDVMSEYASQREQFGAVIGSHQLVRALIADAFVDAAAARELAVAAARSVEARAGSAVIDTNVAKQFAARAATRVTADAAQVLGANGCWEGHPAERLLRESKILEVIEGTTQLQQLIIAEHALAGFTSSRNNLGKIA